MKVSSLVVATLVVVAAAVIGIGHESQFVFDPETMHRVAKQAIADNPANDPQGIVDSVRSLLKKEYPDDIVDDLEWLFNNTSELGLSSFGGVTGVDHYYTHQGTAHKPSPEASAQLEATLAIRLSLVCIKYPKPKP